MGPIGVLYDLHGNGELPWSIEVNFMNFPSDKIQRWENEEALKEHFMNNLKEANHLRDRHNSAINALTKDDQTNLWTAVTKQDFSLFWDIHPKLSKSVDTIKFIPIRIITSRGTCRMPPITSKKNNTEELTLLKDVLNNIPEYTNENEYQVLVHGIVPPLETPISWLAYHC